MQEPRDPASDEPNLPTSELATPPAGRPSRWGRYAGTAVAIFFGLSGIAGVLSYLAGPDVPSAILCRRTDSHIAIFHRTSVRPWSPGSRPSCPRTSVSSPQTGRRTGSRAETEGGLARLDDSTLTRSFLLYLAAMDRIPVQACGDMARVSRSGGDISESTWIASLTAFDAAERMEWIRMGVAAVEAQARGIRIPRIVSEDEADRVFDAMDALASLGEASAMQAIGHGTTPSDAELCAGAKAFGTAAMRLSAADSRDARQVPDAKVVDVVADLATRLRSPAGETLARCTALDCP